MMSNLNEYMQVLVFTVSSRHVLAIFMKQFVDSLNFQSFGQGCLDSENCQTQIVNVDTASKINLYSLSTVATTFQVSVNNNGIVNQAGNMNGFASTVTSWSPS